MKKSKIICIKILISTMICPDLTTKIKLIWIWYFPSQLLDALVMQRVPEFTFNKCENFKKLIHGYLKKIAEGYHAVRRRLSRSTNRSVLSIWLFFPKTSDGKLATFKLFIIIIIIIIIVIIISVLTFAFH